MEIKKQRKDYIDFTFEDFLQDDFFIKSILNPTKESELFWKDYQEENKEYEKAARCIQDLNKNLLDEEDVRKVWHHIQTSNHNRPAKNRRIYIISTVVAASIALFFCIKFYFTEESTDWQDIRVFANNNIPVVETTEIKLFVSDDKIISLPEKETVIEYDSASIKVTSQETLQEEISKDEIADFNQLIIPKGKRSFLTLSDGTQIWVNSGTRLVYPAAFPDDKREIFVDGEIYIHVQPDHNRPFIVQTGDMDIRVLGTEFNVQAYQTERQKRVVLKSGSVKISSDISKEEIVLQPAEMYEATGTNIIVKPTDINNYIWWINGMYICERERLDFILTRLSRYYGKEITVDEKAAGLKCNGKLDLKENLDDVMHILKYIVPVDYTRENNIYSVTYKP